MVDPHRQLPLARGHDDTLRPQPVAEVGIGELVEDVRVDVCLVDEQLNRTAGVLERPELELAEGAMQHQPPGDTDAAVADLVATAGYALAVTCEPGPVTANANPLLLPRVEVTGTTSARELVGQLARLRAST